MPLDALCLSGVIHELNTSLAGARVDKIYQPGRDEVVLALRTQSVGNVRLLLSANPAHPRLHLTTLPLENPEKPPMFCMLLRKHMSGARLLEIAQTPLERQDQPSPAGRRRPHSGLHPAHWWRRHYRTYPPAGDVLPAPPRG